MLFTLDLQTSIITTNTAIDRETLVTPTIKLTLQGSDSNQGNYYQVIKIYILDINDNSPTFSRSNHTVIVSEEIGPQIFDLPSWSDSDSDDNGRLKQVQIVDLPDQSWPFIPEIKTTGNIQQIVLKITKSLDREESSRYDFVITIEDNGYPPLTGSLDVSIKVQDINDNSPVFDMVNSTFYLDENVVTPYNIATFVAIDADANENSKVQYSLSQRTPYFAINMLTGVLSLEKDVDYESCPSIRTGLKGFSIRVSAHDMGQSPRYSVMSVEIVINDVNDNYPAIKFYSPFMTTPDIVELQENIAPKTYTATVIVSDKDGGDNGEFDVFIEGSKKFELENTSGFLILTAGDLDREDTPSYSLIINVIDRGVPPLQQSKLLTVIILDVNDNAPKFTQSLYSTSIMENALIGTFVISVEANDPDNGINGSVKYTIESQSDGNNFIISPGGSISSIRLFDAEDMKYHILNISACDGGETPLVSYSTVNISVTDVNDNYPIFKKPLYTCLVLESTAQGSIVCSVEASDLDNGHNGEIVYTIDPVNDFFTIDSLGNIKLTTMLDFETKKKHQLTIRAADKGSPSSLSTTCELIVEVSDVNDEAPIFNPKSYTISIPEDMIFLKLLQLHVLDRDQHDTILFSILGETQHFDVSSKGIISNIQTLNYSSGNIYNLKISAEDGAGNIALVPASVQINILKNSDDLPVFSQPIIEVSVEESILVGHVVTTVTASTKSSCFISYSFESIITRYFTINSSSGELKLKSAIDFEQIQIISIPILATCQSTKGYAIVEVKVIDINDNSPQCDSLVDAYVKEDALIGSTVHSLVCSDKDSGLMGELTYEILSSTYFSIDIETGDIKLVSLLDREVQSVIKISIQICDKGEKAKKCTIYDVTFHVLDINDNIPQILNPLVFYVAEDVKLNHDIGSLKAVDADDGKNGQFLFTVLNSITEVSVFSSGQIVVDEILDYEKIDRFFLNIRVSDQGIPPLSSDTIVTIIVQDANDNYPKFEKDHYYFDVKESERISYVIGSVIATDHDTGDNSKITYALVDNDAFIAVDPLSGQLTLTKQIDHEGPSTSYNITIQAFDNGIKPLKSQVIVTINIIDVNDNSPVFSQQVYTASFYEDVEVDYEIVRFSASDKDGTSNNQISYSIIEKYDKFRVDPVTGDVYTTSIFDFETKPDYNISLTASDNGSPILTSIAYLVVSLIDVNDNAPVFESAILQIGVIESTQSGTIIKKIQATDIDSENNGKISYAITSDSDPGYFSVESDYGNLRLLKKLIYSEKVYNLKITATDHGSPQLYSSQNVEVTVVDVNDNSPKFMDGIIEVDIVENCAVESFVFQVSADDQDSGAAGIVNFNISSPLLKIGVSDGKVYVAKNIDRESVKIIETSICAIDQAFPISEQLSVCKDVTINVLDTNDNAPVFLDSDTDIIHVLENTKILDIFTRINVSDPDFRENSTLHFSILNQVPDGMVSIDSDVGDIRLLKPVDFEVAYIVCTVTIGVSDKGTPPLHSSKLFQILALDYNDNAPSFTNPSSQRAVYLSDSIEAGNVIFAASAIDIDSGENGQVSYSLTKNSDTFEIDSKSGKISVLYDIDSFFSTISLGVKASDSGTPSLFSTMSVYIEYREENTKPVCPHKSYFSVSEGDSNYLTLFFVDCYDLDWGERGLLQYEILDGNVGDKFSLTKSGKLTLTSHMLDYEEWNLYNMAILVEDGGKPPLKNIFLLEINVLNVNDEKPVFIEDELLITLREDTAIGSLIKTIVATDADLESLSYSISEISQYCKGYFVINSQTGQLTLLKEIDNTLMTEDKLCKLTVSATDGLFMSYLSVSIKIEDIDNFPPLFYSSSQFTVILENSAIVGAVGATDIDNGDLYLDYFIVPSTKRSADFIIDEKTGVISCPNLSCTTGHLTVKALGRVLSDEKTIQIDVSQSPTQQVFDSTHFSFSVLESANIDFIIGRISFINDPNDVSIESGNYKHTFKLDNSNLVVNSGLDYELFPSYNLTLCARLQGICSFAFVYIVVEDINDNPPLFLPSVATIRVIDDIDIGRQVYKAVAIDGDSELAGQLLYYIEDPVVNNFFEIDTISGQVMAKQELRKAPNFINIKIKAKDQGLPVLTSNTFNLNVNVIHQPGVPQFQQSPFNFSTYASATLFSIVGQIKIQSDLTNDYRFEFETESNYFTIYPVSGKIIQKAPITNTDIAQVVEKVRVFSHTDPSIHQASDVLINIVQSICTPSPCQNNGLCFDSVESFECKCNEGSQGKHCECVDTNCQNQGVCFYNSSMSAAQCLCEDGYYRDNCDKSASFVMIAVIAGGCGAVLILMIAVVLFCIIQNKRKSEKKAANQDFENAVNGSGFQGNKRMKGQLNLKESICLNPINVSDLDKHPQQLSQLDYGYTNHDYDLDSPLAIQQLSSHGTPTIFEYAASDSGQSSNCTEAVIFNKLQQVDEPNSTSFQRRDKDSGLAGSLNTLCHFDMDLNNETYTQDYLHDWGPKVQNLVNVLDLDERESDEDAPIKEEFV